MPRSTKSRNANSPFFLGTGLLLAGVSEAMRACHKNSKIYEYDMESSLEGMSQEGSDVRDLGLKKKSLPSLRETLTGLQDGSSFPKQTSFLEHKFLRDSAPEEHLALLDF